MNSIVSFISQYVSYWPLVAFGALLLSGLNLPISEDAIIILSATFAQTDSSILLPNYIAIYSGIFLADIIVYCTGKLLGMGILKIKVLQKRLTPERINWVSSHLEKHGLKTFILCRFIPFGVRSMLFMGSGFVKLPFKKFLFYNSIAGFISSSTLYWLVYFIGEVATSKIKIIGIIAFICVITGFIIAGIKVNKETKKQIQNPPTDIES
jgi:membrane protein DedA with SNARE-associated domain